MLLTFRMLSDFSNGHLISQSQNSLSSIHAESDEPNFAIFKVEFLQNADLKMKSLNSLNLNLIITFIHSVIRVQSSQKYDHNNVQMFFFVLLVNVSLWKTNKYLIVVVSKICSLRSAV